MGMKVSRERFRPSDHPDMRFVYLRFVDGLVVDPRTCPLGIMARPHWRLSVSGQAVCVCVEPEDEHSA